MNVIGFTDNGSLSILVGDGVQRWLNGEAGGVAGLEI